MLESANQKAIRAKACQLGFRLFRNNSGALLDKRGIPVRFGLANESKAMNLKLKSSDLIGIYRKTGQFTAFECKEPDWKYTGTEREVAQKAFIDLVLKDGGIAAFIKDPEELLNYV